VSTEPALPPTDEVKRIKKEETADKEEREEEEEKEKMEEEEEQLRCEECGILFSQLGTYTAHRQYYCQKRRDQHQQH
jgi:hypothetical protein